MRESVAGTILDWLIPWVLLAIAVASLSLLAVACLHTQVRNITLTEAECFCARYEDILVRTQKLVGKVLKPTAYVAYECVEYKRK